MPSLGQNCLSCGAPNPLSSVLIAAERLLAARADQMVTPVKWDELARAVAVARGTVPDEDPDFDDSDCSPAGPMG